MQLPAQHLRHVRLHADGASVAVVRGPVGALLVGADVAVGAAMHAAHVGIEGPAKRHARASVERTLARLFAIDDRVHGKRHDSTYVL